MRQLATIKKISSISPIKGKDRIVLAAVDGWSVIVKKDEFLPGDLCIYVEIDSVLPQRPEFEFLRSKDFRIKTMKMGGVISQGICFPLSVLPNPAASYCEGDDVTQILGIRQYEGTMDAEPQMETPYVHKNKTRKYPKFLMRIPWFRKLVLPKKINLGFPSFISKTDETRIQNMPFILTDKETRWVATEKIDGQSGTFALVRHKSKFPFIKDKFEFIVCSRNNRLLTPDNSSYWSAAKKYAIEDKLKAMIENRPWVAIQGEIIGPKIQKNKYNVKDYSLFVFNVITPDGRLPSVTAEFQCAKHGLPFVPIIEENIVLPDSVKEILDYVHGESKLHPTLREGIVFRSNDGKKSFKAVDPLFLLKHNE